MLWEGLFRIFPVRTFCTVSSFSLEGLIYNLMFDLVRFLKGMPFKRYAFFKRYAMHVHCTFLTYLGESCLKIHCMFSLGFKVKQKPPLKHRMTLFSRARY